MAWKESPLATGVIAAYDKWGKVDVPATHGRVVQVSAGDVPQPFWCCPDLVVVLSVPGYCRIRLVISFGLYISSFRLSHMPWS